MMNCQTHGNINRILLSGMLGDRDMIPRLLTLTQSMSLDIYEDMVIKIHYPLACQAIILLGRLEATESIPYLLHIVSTPSLLEIETI
jgi:hypothetical protein